MHNYESSIDAINDLKSRGFEYDFNVRDTHIECSQIELILEPEDFTIVEHYRFEGDSDPGDNTIVYGIEGSEGHKGVMVMAYGMYADTITGDLAKKLDYLPSNENY